MIRAAKVVTQLANGGRCILGPVTLGAKRTKHHDGGSKSATDMVVQLQGLFESREKGLNEREAALEKRLRLFEEQYPQAGKDSDVLHLNVGGSSNVAVLRRTLTHFENSALAARFSGRCDTSLEKAKGGNFFIDQDPNVFVPLLNYLRQCDQRKRDDLIVQAPLPTYEFCSMLEYYGLMSCVYPQEWRNVSGSTDGVIMTRHSSSDDSMTITNSKDTKVFMLEVQHHCPRKPANATTFTATFEQGSTGQVGWESKETKDSFLFDLSSSEFLANSSSCANGLDWSKKLPVTICCKRNVTTNVYSIQVLESDSDAIIMARFKSNSSHMFPRIELAGKVRISNVLYDF